jgi:hypothetical protein
MIRACASRHLSLGRLHASVQGWVNHVRHANTVGLRKAIFRKHALGRQ